ncbi:hypothetical protein [Alcanivorax hongdengensis]|nr:hypothetical protein [Alcanivorax hongdengensis]
MKPIRRWPRFLHLLLLPTLLLGSSVAGADSQWQPVDKGDKRTDISTFERPVKDSEVKAFRGVTEVHASVLSLLAVMADASVCDQWLYQCQSLELRDNHRAYIQFKGIWPAKDRDALIESDASQDSKTGAVTIASHAVKGEPDHKGLVRVAALRDRFVFTPLKDGWTRVEFETYIDPGGNVTGIANTISHDAPRETLKGMRKLAKQSPYKEADLEDVLKRYDSLKGMDLPAS